MQYIHVLYMYYYILDLSPLFLGCYLRPGLGSSTLHQVQVQVQVFSFFILQVQVQVQVQWFFYYQVQVQIQVH